MNPFANHGGQKHLCQRKSSVFPWKAMTPYLLITKDFDLKNKQVKNFLIHTYVFNTHIYIHINTHIYNKMYIVNMFDDLIFIIN